ncbi:MAG TPA: NAD(P)-dependent oxidoreductase [Fimbriimonadaceae bacterium]
MAKVGFVGLGVMGGPMAGHLANAGLDLTVWNRTESKAEPLKQAGAKTARSLEELGAECDVVFLCVSRSEDVQDCIAQLTKRAKPNTLFVDHSTILPDVSKSLRDELRTKEFRFVDAPITGGSMGAQKGQLTIFCGGEEADVAEAIEIMKPYTKRAERVGGAGAGQLTKMANQIAVGGTLLALCESLAFAEKAGIDIAKTRDLLAGGAAGSWSMDNYGPKILNRDWSPGFKVKDQLKDFKYCIESARQIDAAIPGTVLLDELLTKTAENGGQDKTTAFLFETLLEEGFRD